MYKPQSNLEEQVNPSILKDDFPQEQTDPFSDVSYATVRVVPDLLKALAILSDTTVRRSAVDREDLKPYWRSEKRPHSSR